MSVDTKSTRELIIDSAFDLFITNGYHGTSMRNIADAAELAVSGIYNHFANKKAIFQAVIKRWHPFMQMHPQLEMVTGNSVRERLVDTIERIIQTYEANPKTYHLLFIEIVEFDTQHLPIIFEEIYPSIQTWVRHLKQAEGQLRIDADDLLFQWLMSILFAYFTAKYIMKQQINMDNFISIYVDGMIL